MTRFTIDPARSRVWVEGSSSIHPIHASATGLEGWVEVDLDDGHPDAGGDFAGRVEIALERLKSGSSLVDRETRRRVDARRYPRIVGEVTRVDDIDGDRVHVHGEIAFRGEVSAVEGDLTVTPLPDRGVVIEGSQTFDVRDWGLEPPRLLMLEVHPDVMVRIRAEAHPR